MTVIPEGYRSSSLSTIPSGPLSDQTYFSGQAVRRPASGAGDGAAAGGTRPPASTTTSMGWSARFALMCPLWAGMRRWSTLWPSGNGLALHTYDFLPGKGLVTDMNAIRRDEELDNLHSIYVDQWDWEKVMLEQERTPDYLEDTVRRIVNRHLRHPG